MCNAVQPFYSQCWQVDGKKPVLKTSTHIMKTVACKKQKGGN